MKIPKDDIKKVLIGGLTVFILVHPISLFMGGSDVHNFLVFMNGFMGMNFDMSSSFNVFGVAVILVAILLVTIVVVGGGSVLLYMFFKWLGNHVIRILN